MRSYSWASVVEQGLRRFTSRICSSIGQAAFISVEAAALCHAANVHVSVLALGPCASQEYEPIVKVDIV